MQVAREARSQPATGEVCRVASLVNSLETHTRRREPATASGFIGRSGSPNRCGITTV